MTINLKSEDSILGRSNMLNTPKQMYPIILFIISITFIANTHAGNLCKELNKLANEISSFPDKDEVNEEGKKIFLNNFFSSIYKNLVGPGAIDTNVEYQYGITIDSGNSLIPTCEGSGVQTSIYYPLGLQVNILGKKKLPLNGKMEPFYYVIAEHGLRIFIPANHVQEIKEDSAYYFQDGMGGHLYCVESKLCDKSSARPGQPSLHPDTGYASRELIPAHKNRINKYREIRSELCKDEPLSIDEKEELESKIASICDPFRVTHYEDRGIMGYKEAFLSLCVEDPKQPESMPPKMQIGTVKVVTLDDTKKLFSHGIHGSFNRISSSYDSIISKMREKLEIDFLVRKECDTEVLTKHSFTASGGVKGGSSNLAAKLVSVVNLEAVGEINRGYMSSVQRKQKEGEYFILSSYSLTPIPNLYSDLSWDQQKNKQIIYDIKSLSVCENNLPREAVSITIYHEELGGEHSILPAKSALRDSYVQKYGNYGIQPLTEPDYLALGMFWSIGGSDQFFLWKNLIQQTIDENPKWCNFFRSIPKEKQEMVRSFFTHLILSSAFDFS